MKEQKKNADYWIDKIGMIVHPEGGYYKEVYRSDEFVSDDALPDRFSGERAFSTSIYFLLKDTQVSAFHRIKSDELWHFYTGSLLTIHKINDAGDYQTCKLGGDLERGEAFQVVVPAGVWFGATLEDASSFALVGCTVSPGFHFDDFELAKREDMLVAFPEHRHIIETLALKD